MENFDYEQYPVLAEAYAINKYNGHSWYSNTINFINNNGMGYITNNPAQFSEILWDILLFLAFNSAKNMKK